VKVAINAVSAKVGGAVTYMQNMLPLLRDRLADGRIAVWRPDDARAADWPTGIDYRSEAGDSVGKRSIGGPLRRLWFDQVRLPRAVEAEGFDALFSSANFGPLRVRRRHVLLVRNALYFDETSMRRMTSAKVRGYFHAQRMLTLSVMRGADAVLFPTKAMLDLVAEHTHTGRERWRVAPFGARHALFAPLVERSAPNLDRPTRLLNVAVYYDQKNFETLLRAVKLLERETPRQFNLEITAGFHRDAMGKSSLFPNFDRERAIFRDLEALGAARDVDWKHYGSLPALYHSADIFVFPSYAESFGHPLVEAMAAGLPIVASDIAVNREMCGDAAIYFPVFDAEACAVAIRRVREEPGLALRLSKAGMERVKAFSWESHVDVLAAALEGKVSTVDASARR
jgi:glycosyltransferase involved in cell wall biosynthesis